MSGITVESRKKIVSTLNTDEMGMPQSSIKYK